jgi:hypothetical protein
MWSHGDVGGSRQPGVRRSVPPARRCICIPRDAASRLEWPEPWDDALGTPCKRSGSMRGVTGWASTRDSHPSGHSEWCQCRLEACAGASGRGHPQKRRASDLARHRARLGQIHAHGPALAGVEYAPGGSCSQLAKPARWRTCDGTRMRRPSGDTSVSRRAMRLIRCNSVSFVACPRDCGLLHWRARPQLSREAPWAPVAPSAT